MTQDHRRVFLAWTLVIAGGCGSSTGRRTSTAPRAPGAPAVRAATRCDPACCRQCAPRPARDQRGLPALARALRQQEADETVIHDVDRQSLVSMLQAPLVDAQLLPGRSGGPPFLVGLKTPVGKILVIPYECSLDRCKSIQFYYGLDLSGRIPASVVNEFNRKFRFGRAYVDGEGDPCLEWDLDLEPGVSRASVPATLKLFMSIVGRYVVFLGNHAAAASGHSP